MLRTFLCKIELTKDEVKCFVGRMEYFIKGKNNKGSIEIENTIILIKYYVNK